MTRDWDQPGALPRHVYFYMQDFLPRQDGSGPYLRAYSNARAYLDLGFHLEIIHIQARPDFPFTPDPTLAGARWTHLPVTPSRRCDRLHRAAFRLGWPFRLALDCTFRSRPAIRAAVRQRERQTPGALHHFEYLQTACAAIDYPGLKSIWSFLDFESTFLQEHALIRQELGLPPRDDTHLKIVARAERLAAAQCRLILSIAWHETAVLRDDWGCRQAAFFPMSWPVEEAPPRARQWLAGGKLRLLHVGRIDSLSSYRSLPFILQEVLPRLAPETLDNLELLVVGKIQETRRAQTILSLAEPYPQVRFLDYQEDLLPFYATCDLQVVGSTVATGLRTRIIESFVYGLPVLSTIPGAEGVAGLRPGENILLAADADAFVRHLQALHQDPARLDDLSRQARLTYDTLYSRTVTAQSLAALLTQTFG